ncbi:MAG: DUF499 domain-containing protein, partial [Candidatus Hadarchaeum sp.]
MKSILETCIVRPDILTGSFNPEIFTASLSHVMDFYRGRPVDTHSPYIDAAAFFRDATFPTQGLRMVLRDVLGRLSGDNTCSAIHRLETAFGGGKTHILIALAHLGKMGRELKSVTEPILEDLPLMDPGQVYVVGIAGEELPVMKPRGKELVPYTLWGEIAFQIGEELYRELKEEADSYAAPGKEFLERVLGGRKVLILVDELAQYATRLEAAVPRGGDQLGAFLLTLNGYARTHSGIAIVVSLASQADAFYTQTQRLAKLLSSVKGQDLTE